MRGGEWMVDGGWGGGWDGGMVAVWVDGRIGLEGMGRWWLG